jgi:hypothetical protein
MHNIERAGRKDNGTTAYDLSTAQKVSSSTFLRRNMCHIRRVLAIIAWWLVTATLR